MRYADKVVAGGLLMILGALIFLVGIDLHDTRSYSQTYETALKIHPSGLLMLIAGAVLAVLGFAAIVAAMVTDAEVSTKQHRRTRRKK
jgi:putative Mn2+ efflux pump MntP